MRTSVLRVTLLLFAVVFLSQKGFSQGTPIQPCQADSSSNTSTAPSGSSPKKTDVKGSEILIDASIKPDADLEKMLKPYTDAVRPLSIVIGRLDGTLKKQGVGAGAIGNFVADGIRAEARAKTGQPIALAMINAGGLRKNEIQAGEIRASDIFELLPFENKLVVLEMTGSQVTKLMQLATRDAQSGARIEFKWNDQGRAEFISGKLIDESGREVAVDNDKLYKIVTIDYLVNLKSGSYALLQEAKSITPLDITIRDAIMEYVKAETAAKRAIKSQVDDRFVQIGPDPKTTPVIQ